MTKAAWIAVASSLALGVSGCGTTTESMCVRAADCADGTTCIAGTCTPTMACSSSRMCPGLVCNVTLGVCVECNTTADCDPGLMCVSGVCGTAMPDEDVGVDAGMDAAMPGADSGRDAGVDAFIPVDGGIDAFVGVDAWSNDAAIFPGDTLLPDAFVPPDMGLDAMGCMPGLRYCSGMCVDTTSDPMNCSNCGIACPGGYACISSGCMCITRCSGVCSDLQNDVNNCGGCGHACGPGDYCQGGACFRPPCQAGEAMCNGCANYATDINNCGSCGHVCPASNYCVAGACSPTCPPPLDPPYWGSYGGCRDADSDPYACGSGSACGADEVCELAVVSGGGSRGVSMCLAACSPGLTQCDRSCVNTQLNVLNCGSCGHACGIGEYCANGTCGMCPAGESLCGLGCTNYATDINNCGSCGHVCPASNYCVAGACSPTCPPPLDPPYWGSYGGCRDADSDPYACGSGSACGADEVCELAVVSGGGSRGVSMSPCVREVVAS